MTVLRMYWYSILTTASIFCNALLFKTLSSTKSKVLASKLLGKDDAPLAAKDAPLGDVRQDAAKAPTTTTTTTTTINTTTAEAVAAQEQTTSGRLVAGDEAGVTAAGGSGKTAVRGGEEGGVLQGGAAEEGAGTSVTGERKKEEVRIVAVDLQEMAPIDGVKQLQVRVNKAVYRTPYTCNVGTTLSPNIRIKCIPIFWSKRSLYIGT